MEVIKLTPLMHVAKLTAANRSIPWLMRSIPCHVHELADELTIVPTSTFQSTSLTGFNVAGAQVKYRTIISFYFFLCS
jgi:hypothetical protein